MRFLIITILLAMVCFVSSKTETKSLTESMGQEVIEIGAPLKDLPSGLEEEPSAEIEEEEKHASNTISPATKKETKKTTTIPESRRKSVKDIDKIDGLSQEDEEARIEKELAEIYKDTDYKADSAESKEKYTSLKYTSEKTTEEIEKPIQRAGDNFKFQPDTTNNAAVERFRTSVDEINCDKSATQKMSGDATPSTGSPLKTTIDFAYIFLITSLTLCF